MNNKKIIERKSTIDSALNKPSSDTDCLCPSLSQYKEPVDAELDNPCLSMSSLGLKKHKDAGLKPGPKISI